MKKWRVKYTKEAGADLGFFINQQPGIWDEIKRIISLLSEEDDPRHPQNAELNVEMIEHDAPGWWRVQIGKPGPFWLRLVFALMGTRHNKEVEIEQRDKADEFNEPRSILITDVCFRKDAYGKRLRQRYQKIKGDKN